MQRREAKPSSQERLCDDLTSLWLGQHKPRLLAFFSTLKKAVSPLLQHICIAGFVLSSQTFDT